MITPSIRSPLIKKKIVLFVGKDRGKGLDLPSCSPLPSLPKKEGGRKGGKENERKGENV